MENTLVPSVSSVVSKPIPTSKNQMIQVGIGCLVLVVVLFFVYRFVKKLNKRISNLEDVMARLIEKNNYLQNCIQQQSRNPSPVVTMPHVSAPVPQNVSPNMVTPPIYTPPSVPQSVESAPKPVDLDAELQAELQELESPPVVVNAPVVEEKVEEEEIPEGRVDT